MKDLLGNLIPQGRRGLYLWFVLLVALYGVYYFGGPYSQAESWYNDRERQPDLDQDIEIQLEENPSLEVGVSHIRAIRPIADFLENEVIVTVQNLTPERQMAIVQLEIIPNTTRTAPTNPPRVYIKTPLVTRNQDTAILEDIPPHAKVQATFMVRIADGEVDKEYPIQVNINSESLKYGTNFAFLYHPHERLKMWLISQLLLPPGADIFMPIITMLFASWLVNFSTELRGSREQMTSFCQKLKELGKQSKDEGIREILKSLRPVSFLNALKQLISDCQEFKIEHPLAARFFPWIAMMGFIPTVVCLSLPKSLANIFVGGFLGGTLLCLLPCVHAFLGIEEQATALSATANPTLEAICLVVDGRRKRSHRSRKNGDSSAPRRRSTRC